MRSAKELKATFLNTDAEARVDVEIAEGQQKRETHYENTFSSLWMLPGLGCVLFGVHPHPHWTRCRRQVGAQDSPIPVLIHWRHESIARPSHITGEGYKPQELTPPSWNGEGMQSRPSPFLCIPLHSFAFLCIPLHSFAFLCAVFCVASLHSGPGRDKAQL